MNLLAKVFFFIAFLTWMFYSVFQFTYGIKRLSIEQHMIISFGILIELGFAISAQVIF